MVDPFAPSFAEKLNRSRNFLGWMGGMAAVSCVGFYFIAERPATQPVQEYATVVSFGVENSDDGGKPIMNVLLDEERLQTIRIRENVLRSCQKDDQVLLNRKGLSLSVAPQACETLEAPA